MTKKAADSLKYPLNYFYANLLGISSVLYRDSAF